MFVSTIVALSRTCGTTTLLHAIEPLIELVQTSVPGAAVQVRRQATSYTHSPLHTGRLLLAQDVSATYTTAATTHQSTRRGTATFVIHYLFTLSLLLMLDQVPRQHL